MNDLGEAQACLVLEISRDRPNRTLRLSQGKYTQYCTRTGRHGERNPGTDPYGVRIQQPPLGGSRLLARTCKRRSISSVHWMLHVLIDMYTTGYCIRGFCFPYFSEQPLAPHWVAVKRILRYIAGSRHQRIAFGLDKNVNLIGYTNSDWGGCRDSRKSTSGYVFLIAGGPVCWRSKTRTIVAT